MTAASGDIGSVAEREVSPALVHALLRYVDRVAGPELVREIVARAGIEMAHVADETRWFRSTEVIAIAEAAAAVCHDDDIGRAAGAEMWRMLSRKPGYLDLVRSAGSIDAAVAAAAARGSKMSTGRVQSVASADVGHLMLVATYANLDNAHRYYCGFSAGFYSQVPRAFGMTAEAIELDCQLDGADCCRWRVTWEHDGAAQPDAAELSDSAKRAQEQLDQLEEVHQLTSELLSADRVDEVLARITAQAGRAVQAPRYLLAVRISDRDRWRVHHRGFRAGTADAFAERLLAGSVSEADGVLVAEVESQGRHYGRLAACYPRGSTFAEMDRRVLGAYARHAAAVVEHVASLERARTDRDTARALLDLARSLAGATTTAEVARRLVDTVPRVVSCDVASLWNWDAKAQQLRLAAYAGASGTTGFAGPHYISASELTGLVELAANPEPRLLDARQASMPVRRMLTAMGADTAATVPVVTHGEFTGVICAAFRGEVPDEDLLLGRLAGLADHAAVALHSVRLVERMSHQALHDNLTGLANRQLLQEHGEQAIAAARDAQDNVALLFIDLDRFKNVNDTLGHAAGDELIRQAAQRIGDCTRPNDVLARLGGDEFLLLLHDVSSAEAAVVAAERIVEALRAPFHLNGRQQVFISCSIGIACYPDHGRDYATLVHRADVAMYQAKAAGRNSVAVYSADSGDVRRSSIELEAELRRAVDRGDLEVYYQPEFDLASGAVTTVEALVRWSHPAYGVLEPPAFITLAEDTGLISDIDTFVRSTAFAAVRRWHDAGHRVRLAVNLCERDLRRRGFAGLMAVEADAAGVPAELVEVEIADRVTLDDDELRELLDEFGEQGFRVAIDDFGTGSSVLGRLHKCRVHTLKIDRSFVRDLGDGASQGLVVQALLSLATGMGLTTVVEGVEEVRQLDAVRRFGADLAQGFLLSPPVPEASIANLLAKPGTTTPTLLRSRVARLPQPRATGTGS